MRGFCFARGAHARLAGPGPEAHERLLRAQLVEGQLLEDPATLARLAAEVGVPEAEALASGAFADSVALDLEEAAALGINSVPSFVLDRKYGMPGAQATEVLLSALEQVRREAAAEIWGRRASPPGSPSVSPPGASCPAGGAWLACRRPRRDCGRAPCQGRR